MSLFGNVYQNGFLSILSTVGSKPLQLWTVVTDSNSDTTSSNKGDGYIKRITDKNFHSNLILELSGSDITRNYILCPADPSKTLDIKLHYIIFVIKLLYNQPCAAPLEDPTDINEKEHNYTDNEEKCFSFEVQVIDDTSTIRRFRVSNFQSVTRIKPYICVLPLRLVQTSHHSWNRIQMNLSDLTYRAYGTRYMHCIRIQVHSNCQIRRIFFSDRLYIEEEYPMEFKLFS